MIIYTDDLSGMDPEQLHGFFDDWSDPPTSAIHLRLLRGSDTVVMAKDEASGRVVGFVTAVTDNVLSAYIPLLEVLPAYREQGIGSELVRRILRKLDHLYMVDLLCDAELQPFYERMGMRPATGMMIRNYARQSGN